MISSYCNISGFAFSSQSTKIKKGSRGDTSVLMPTLMAAVPVCHEFGSIHGQPYILLEPPFIYSSWSYWLSLASWTRRSNFSQTLFINPKNISVQSPAGLNLLGLSKHDINTLNPNIVSDALLWYILLFN